MSFSKLATRAMTHVIRSNHRHRRATRGTSLEANRYSASVNNTPSFLENHRRTHEVWVFGKRYVKTEISKVGKTEIFKVGIWLANCLTVYAVQHWLFFRSKERASSKAMKDLTDIAHEVRYLGVSNLAKLDAITLDLKAASDEIKEVIKAVSDDIKAVSDDIKAVTHDVKAALKKHDR